MKPNRYLTKRQLECLKYLSRFEYLSTAQLKKAGYKYHITQPLLYSGYVDRTHAEPPPFGESRTRGRPVYYWWVNDAGAALLREIERANSA
jgi:hypothetical protein